MRIGIDAACWANHRGYGRYARELIRAMVAVAPGHQFTCYLDESARSTFDVTAANVRVMVVPQSAPPTQAASAFGRRSIPDMLRFSFAVWRDRPDVFFSPSVYTYFPLWPWQRSIVTIHDAIADRFPELTLPTPSARRLWRWKVWLATRQATRILTVSDYAREELVRYLGIPMERIRVSGEAPAAVYQPSGDDDIRRTAERYGIPPGREWFIYVGGFNPHKHVDVLARAHGALTRERATPPLLVLVGATVEGFHADLAGVRAAVEQSGAAHLVHWLGFVPDQDLRHLLAGAVALVLPSESEGFGLPAVEAAACGTPVVATTESPLPVLLAGGGVFVAPRDEPGLASAMRELLDAPARRRDLSDGALRAARALTWEAAARRALGALEEVA